MPSFYVRRGKRCFDCVAAGAGVLLLSPVFLALAVAVKLSSKGPVLYKQTRVGQHFQPFTMLKFRSMVVNNEHHHSLVTSSTDTRITAVGAFLRRFKLDELPQLLNVVMGHMSLVGPRPEVMRYVRHFQLDYAGICRIKPGITDNAAIAFKDEESLLAAHENVEDAYIQHVLPEKIKLYHAYMANITFVGDIRLILKTIFC